MIEDTARWLEGELRRRSPLWQWSSGSNESLRLVIVSANATINGQAFRVEDEYSEEMVRSRASGIVDWAIATATTRMMRLATEWRAGKVAEWILATSGLEPWPGQHADVRDRAGNVARAVWWRDGGWRKVYDDGGLAEYPMVNVVEWRPR